MPSTSPGHSSKSTSRMAVRRPKRLVRPCTPRIGCSFMARLQSFPRRVGLSRTDVPIVLSEAKDLAVGRSKLGDAGDSPVASSLLQAPQGPSLRSGRRITFRHAGAFVAVGAALGAVVGVGADEGALAGVVDDDLVEEAVVGTAECAAVLPALDLE